MGMDIPSPRLHTPPKVAQHLLSLSPHVPHVAEVASQSKLWQTLLCIPLHPQPGLSLPHIPSLIALPLGHLMMGEQEVTQESGATPLGLGAPQQGNRVHITALA